MKKCPECGNPSYDGAPVCGNCGYKFPLPKPRAPKTETNIFKEPEKKKTKKPQEESTLQIIKDNKIVIGIIIAVTIIAICGIILSGNHSENNITQTNELTKFSEAGFSFSFPSTWKEIAGDDPTHETAIFFDAGNDTIVEFYNITSDYTSLKEINHDRIVKAQSNGDYVNSVETLTIDERNSSNMIIENADGDYTRYVSIFADGKLYVYKITGNSLNNINSTAINDAIATSHIG